MLMTMTTTITSITVTASDLPHGRGPSTQAHLCGVTNVSGVARNGVKLRQGLTARVTHKAPLHVLPQELPARVTCAVVLPHFVHRRRRELATSVALDGHVLMLGVQESAQSGGFDRLEGRKFDVTDMEGRKFDVTDM